MVFQLVVTNFVIIFVPVFQLDIAVVEQEDFIGGGVTKKQNFWKKFTIWLDCPPSYNSEVFEFQKSF